MKKLLLGIFALVFSGEVFSQTSQTFTTVGINTWSCPAGVTTITVQCWGGGGGGGGTNNTNNTRSGSGGGGGAYAANTAVSVTPGTTYNVTVGAGGGGGNGGNNGGNGGASSFNATTVVAAGGAGGQFAAGNTTGGNGGSVAASTGVIEFAGGNGGNGTANSNGGGGGGGAGTANPGTAGTGATAGAGGATGGGNGGAGATVANNDGANGSTLGGGGGGTRRNGDGGNGAQGQVIISWVNPNESCATAISLTPDMTCNVSYGSSYAGVSSGFTCGTGDPDDDLWYSFVATATTHTVTVDGAANYDAVVGAYVSCGGAQPSGGACVNATGANGIETLSLSGLTIGATYYVEVHDNATGGGEFTICVIAPGDECATAIPLTPSSNTTCSPSSFNSDLASTSAVSGCTSGTEDDDMWFSFVATSATHTVTVDGAANYDAAIGAYNTCGGTQPTGGGCVNATGNNGIETLTLSGLTIGNTYYIETHDRNAGGGDFTICITSPGPPNCATYNAPGTPCANGADLSWNAPGAGFAPTGYKLYLGTDNPPTNIINGTNVGNVLTYPTGPLSVSTTYYWQIVPTNAAGDASGCSVQSFTTSASTGPSNDDPCTAIKLTVGSSCSYSSYTNACATATAAGSPPAPGCAGYAGGDVWFYVIVPASGGITFDTQAGVVTDGGMAVYSGASCGALSLIACDDNTGAGNMPQIVLTGQVPNDTLWIRVWENGNNSNGTFGICASNACQFGSPANDICSGAFAMTLGTNLYGNINICTGSAGEPAAGSCWTTGTLNTVWYSVVVPASGQLDIRCSPGSLLATQIALYSGTCGGTLTQVACNNNAAACAGTTYSIAEINATGLTVGATYYVRVDGENDLLGTFSIIAVDGTSSYPGLNGQDCSTPTPVCSSSMTIPNPGYQGIGNKCDHVATGCLGNGERGSHWLEITITGAGNLYFTITPNDYNSAACTETDYDFVMWKTAGAGSTTCNGISTTPANGRVACNWSGLGVTGCSATGNTPAGFAGCNYSASFETGIACAAGDVFLLEVMNFTNSTSGYTIDFSSSTCTIQNASSTSLDWQGSVSVDFLSAVNYGGCSAPACGINATILGSAPYQPTVNTNATVQNITINPGAYLTINPGITLTICGNLVNNGTIYAYPNSTIQFTHPSAMHTMSGTLDGASALGNLVINKAAGMVTINNSLDLQGDFTTSSPTSIFNSNSESIKVGGNFSNNNGGITYINSAGGSIEFNGSSAQTYNQGSSNLNLNNVIINNTSGNVTLNSIMRVSATLTMSSGLLNTTSANILTLLPGASATAGTSASTSYVNGPMKIQKNTTGVSTLNFPIGKYPDCRPVVLTVNHSSTTLYNYEAQSYNAPASFLYYTKPASIDTVSGVHYWDVTRTDNAGVNQPSANLNGNQTIQLFFGTNDYVKDGNYISVVKNTNAAPTTWIDCGGTGGPAAAGGPNLVGSITSTSSPSAFNSFSRFTIGSQTVGNNPLPVELLYFHATPNGKVVDLKWSTATEINNNYFTVERSVDGITFTELEKVNSKAVNGNSTSTLNYVTKDSDPLTGYSYYRLKQTDYDGTSKYSKIVTVNFSKTDEILFTVYPNPNIGTFTVDITGIENNHEVEVNLVDFTGRLVYKTSFYSNEQNNSVVINPLEKINPGIYFCNLVVEGITYTAKVIVN